jgi:hypothetical protein
MDRLAEGTRNTARDACGRKSLCMTEENYRSSGALLMSRWCSTTSLPETPEKTPNVGRKKFRFFHCREMAATRHVGPLRDIEHPLQPSAWRVVNLFRKVCKAHRRQYPLSGGETRGLQSVFPVHLNGGTNALGEPVERQVGKQFIFRKSLLDNPVAIAPRAKLLADPRGQSGRRVVKRRGQCLRPRAVHMRITTLERSPLSFLSKIVLLCGGKWRISGVNCRFVRARQKV